MAWRCRPVLRHRRRLTSFLMPSTRQHPARMSDDDGGQVGLPRRCTFEHGAQGFAATRSVLQKVAAPRVDLGAVDVGPASPLPRAEVEFAKPRVHAVNPTPAAQPSSNICAASQIGGEHNPWQPCPACELLHPSGETLGLAAVDGDIGRANASACSADRSRVAPGPYREIHVATKPRQVPSEQRPR